MAVAESDWHICSWSGSRSGQLLKRALSRRRARCCIRLSATSAPLAVLHSHWLKTIVVGYVSPNVLTSVPCCCRGTPAPGHCASLLNGYAGRRLLCQLPAQHVSHSQCGILPIGEAHLGQAPSWPNLISGRVLKH